MKEDLIVDTIARIRAENPDGDLLALCRAEMPDEDPGLLASTIEILAGGDVYEVDPDWVSRPMVTQPPTDE